MKTDPQVVEKAVNIHLQQLAEFLSKPDLKPGQLASALCTIRAIQKTLDNGQKGGLEPTVKKQIVELLKEQGREVEDTKGMRILKADGWTLPMRPYRTGLDPKKVEGLLRAKGKDPKKYMTEIKTYAIDPEKELPFSKAELTSCEYAESWTVLTPERA